MSGEARAIPSRPDRDRLVDLTWFGLALSFVLVVFFAHEELSTGSPVPRSIDVALGLVSCLALWWRRRRPTEIALLVAVASGVSDASAGAALIMLFTVAVHRPVRSVALVAAAWVVVSIAIVVAWPDPESSRGVDLSLSILLTGGVVAWGMFVRARRLLLLSLQERAERAETEQGLRVEQARQRERTRIAREMHDVLGHRISLISMHAGALEVRAQAADEEIAESAAVIRASAHQALEDLREVIGVLRTATENEGDDDPSGRPQPTLADVRALVAESQQAGMNITFNYGVPETGNTIPTSVGRTAYRVVQEGLTNARKHAPGSAVLVQVNGGPGPGLTVEVRNRRPIGTEASALPGASRGLLGLAERTTLVGGRLDHGRTTDGDFLLQSWLPWSAWRVPERENDDV